MYCSNCGNKVKEELNYCNACGGRIADGEKKDKQTVSANLASSLGYIGAAGFGVLVAIIAILSKNSRIDVPALITIVALFLAALFGICFMILRQISKANGTQEKQVLPDTQYVPPASLNAPTTNQLESPKDAPASVVENTTRTLDKVPVERS